jgi:hypothetical protein
MPNIYGKENIVVLSAELLRRKDSEGRAGGTYSSADDEVIIDMEAARFPPRDNTHYDNRGREGDKGGDDTGIGARIVELEVCHGYTWQVGRKYLRACHCSLTI